MAASNIIGLPGNSCSEVFDMSDALYVSLEG